MGLNMSVSRMTKDESILNATVLVLPAEGFVGLYELSSERVVASTSWIVDCEVQAIIF